MLSRRGVSDATTSFPAYGVWTEAEDVLTQCVDAEVVQLPQSIRHPLVRVRRQAGRIARSTLGADTAVPALQARSPARQLRGEYDLIVFLAYSIWDLPLLERLGRLRNFSDRIAVWFLETWPSAYLDGRVKNEPFHTVDHIFVGLDVAVDPLAETIGRPVQYLPMSTDVTRFGPATIDQERPIDLFVPGRRDEDQHRAMLSWAAAEDRLYMYDTTVVGAPAELKPHRDALGERYAKTKITVCNYAKKDETKVIGQHRVMPGRLWEALAAGCALVGDPPSSESQRAAFGRQVVTPLPEGADEVAPFLENVIASRSHTEIAGQVALAYRGHDWAHRWGALFDQVGLSTPAGLQARIDDLAERSRLLTADL